MMTFDSVAPYYDRLARLAFGSTLNRAQAALLDQLPPGGKWLILGGGTGWLLDQVLNHCHPASVLFLEASPAMLARARRRLAHSPHLARIEFRHGTQADLTPADRCRVILTPFVLDLYAETELTEKLFPALLAALEPNGCWLVTDFVPTGIPWQRALVHSMQLFFRLTARLPLHPLPDWFRLLSESLRPRAQQTFLGGLLRSVLFSA